MYKEAVTWGKHTKDALSTGYYRDRGRGRRVRNGEIVRGLEKITKLCAKEGLNDLKKRENTEWGCRW